MQLSPSRRRRRRRSSRRSTHRCGPPRCLSESCHRSRGPIVGKGRPVWLLGRPATKVRRKLAETRASVSASGPPPPENVTFSTPARKARVRYTNPRPSLVKLVSLVSSSSHTEVAPPIDELADACDQSPPGCNQGCRCLVEAVGSSPRRRRLRKWGCSQLAPSNSGHKQRCGCGVHGMIDS